jgi:hypothetical protein
MVEAKRRDRHAPHGMNGRYSRVDRHPDHASYVRQFHQMEVTLVAAWSNFYRTHGKAGVRGFDRRVCQQQGA